MLEDRDPKVAEAAHFALKNLTGVPLPAEPQVWRDHLATRPKSRPAGAGVSSSGTR